MAQQGYQNKPGIKTLWTEQRKNLDTKTKLLWTNSLSLCMRHALRAYMSDARIVQKKSKLLACLDCN